MERYNMIVKLTPQTTIESFEEGRKRIKAGIPLISKSKIVNLSEQNRFQGLDIC